MRNIKTFESFMDYDIKVSTIKFQTYDIVSEPGFSSAYLIPQKELKFPTIEEFIDKDIEPML